MEKETAKGKERDLPSGAQASAVTGSWNEERR